MASGAEGGAAPGGAPLAFTTPVGPAAGAADACWPLVPRSLLAAQSAAIAGAAVTGLNLAKLAAISLAFWYQGASGELAASLDARAPSSDGFGLGRGFGSG